MSYREATPFSLLKPKFNGAFRPKVFAKQIQTFGEGVMQRICVTISLDSCGDLSYNIQRWP